MSYVSKETAILAAKKGCNIKGAILQEGIALCTQAALQTWLYETHQIWVNSRPIYNANEQMGVQVDISSWKFPFVTLKEKDQFNVSAGLEQGLQEALKKLPSQKKFKYTDADEARMNVIGQNGNDGLHYEREEDNLNG